MCNVSVHPSRCEHVRSVLKLQEQPTTTIIKVNMFVNKKIFNIKVMSLVIGQRVA